MQPINLVLDGPHGLVPIEQTHLVGLGAIQQEIGLLQVVDCVFAQYTIIMHDIEFKIAVFE